MKITKVDRQLGRLPTRMGPKASRNDESSNRIADVPQNMFRPKTQRNSLPCATISKHCQPLRFNTIAIGNLSHSTVCLSNQLLVCGTRRFRTVFSVLVSFSLLLIFFFCHRHDDCHRSESSVKNHWKWILWLIAQLIERRFWIESPFFSGTFREC